MHVLSALRSDSEHAELYDENYNEGTTVDNTQFTNIHYTCLWFIKSLLIIARYIPSCKNN